MAKQQLKHTVRTIDGVTRFIPRQKRFQFLDSIRAKRMLGVLAVVVICVSIALVVVYQKHGNNELNSPSGVKTALAKHMLVPNEQPVIATVTDRSALKTPFLREANNGDKVVIFEKAKRVVIYRPSTDKIVDIGPVELSNIPKTSTQ